MVYLSHFEHSTVSVHFSNMNRSVPTHVGTEQQILVKKVTYFDCGCKGLQTKHQLNLHDFQVIFQEHI